MTTDADLLQASLEMIAESHGDIVPLVYQRFYAQYPETRRMFGRDESNIHQGHMFNGMLLAILEQAEERCPDGSISAWVQDHHLWGVKQPMFRAMFFAVLDTVRECLGTAWDGALEKAWRRQVGRLADRFDAACRVEKFCA